jgi:LacI family transcriptional regulator
MQKCKRLHEEETVLSQIDSKQIAKLVGVSSATVSRVINNSPKVRPETRERVLKVIKQYGYYPNAAASTLAGKATKTIALFMRDPGKCAPYSVVDTQVSGTVEAASRRGYFVLTCMVDDFSSPDGEEMIRRVLCQERADAALFAGCLEHEPALDEVLRWGVIVGAADQDPEAHKSGELTTICLNDYAGVVSQVDYLSSMATATSPF